MSGTRKRRSFCRSAYASNIVTNPVLKRFHWMSRPRVCQVLSRDRAQVGPGSFVLLPRTVPPVLPLHAAPVSAPGNGGLCLGLSHRAHDPRVRIAPTPPASASATSLSTASASAEAHRGEGVVNDASHGMRPDTTIHPLCSYRAPRRRFDSLPGHRGADPQSDLPVWQAHPPVCEPRPEGVRKPRARWRVVSPTA